MILVYTLLFLGSDANKQTHWLSATAGLPVLAFLLALVWSGLLRVSLLRTAQAS
jgi:hypothetical protein